MLKKMIAAYRKNRLYRATYNELYKLTDKELDDIGIVRYEIASIAKETAYGLDENPRLNTFFNFIKSRTEKENIEEYLADSVSLMDLENRIKNIDRGLAPWQIIGKSYAQGFMQ